MTGASLTAGAKILLGGFTLSNEGIDETILRTVGVLAPIAAAGADVVLMAFGMIVVLETALNEGIAAIPGPIEDIGSDGWFIHRSIFGRNDSQDDHNWSLEFDSKGKRIVHGGHAVAIVAEVSSASANINLDISIRMLSMVRGTG